MYAGNEHKLMCAAQHGLRNSTVQLEQGSRNLLHRATLWPERDTQLLGREGGKQKVKGSETLVCLQVKREGMKSLHYSNKGETEKQYVYLCTQAESERE